jgi:hypothetical protein
MVLAAEPAPTAEGLSHEHDCHRGAHGGPRHPSHPPHGERPESLAARSARTGIDHVWHHDRLPFGYRITDTKGTNSARHRLMTPKAFYEAARQGIDIFMAMQDETSIRNATPKATVGDGKEMSHTWVVRKIPESKLKAEHRLALEEATEQWRFDFNKDATGKWRLSGKAPYDRSFVTVVASNIDQHDTSIGGDLPRCSRPVKSHQIAAEFILPTDIYFE